MTSWMINRHWFRCHQVTNHWLSQCWTSSMPSYGVTKPRRIKNYLWGKNTLFNLQVLSILMMFCKKKEAIIMRYNDAIMSAMASQITSVSIVCNCLFRHRPKKTSKLCVTGPCEGIHRSPVDTPQKRPVTRKMFPFDDVIMLHNGALAIRHNWNPSSIYMLHVAWLWVDLS